MGPNRALSRKRERLQFDSGHIVTCESALRESDIMRQQERRNGFDAVDQTLGVVNLKTFSDSASLFIR